MTTDENKARFEAAKQDVEDLVTRMRVAYAKDPLMACVVLANALGVTIASVSNRGGVLPDAMLMLDHLSTYQSLVFSQARGTMQDLITQTVKGMR